MFYSELIYMFYTLKHDFLQCFFLVVNASLSEMIDIKAHFTKVRIQVDAVFWNPDQSGFLHCGNNCMRNSKTIEGFSSGRHIKPILQVTILVAAMLVSLPHSLSLENTTKCPTTFHIVHIIIPNYSWVIRILVHTLRWNFKSYYGVNQKW